MRGSKNKLVELANVFAGRESKSNEKFIQNVIQEELGSVLLTETTEGRLNGIKYSAIIQNKEGFSKLYKIKHFSDSSIYFSTILYYVSFPPLSSLPNPYFGFEKIENKHRFIQ